MKKLLRKLMLLVSMLSMVLLAAAPAFAQDETVTGNVGVGSPVGSNVQACPAVITQVDNEQDVVQFVSGDNVVTVDVQGIGAEAEDVRIQAEFEARGFSPEAAAACAIEAIGVTQAGGGGAGGGAGGGGAAPGGGGGGAGGAGGGGQLPTTGGPSLLALVAGALLVGGGLIARRMVR